MALLLWWLSGREKYALLAPAVPFVSLAGVFSAVLTCITGMLLSGGGEYDSSTVNWHMWMGIATTMVSAWLYSQIRSGQARRQIAYTVAGLLVLVSVTGHLGGSLTHGSDYLSSPFKEEGSGAGGVHVRRVAIADVQKALVYGEVIEPILADKCYGCHGAQKQKGKLRMDQPATLMTGGKHGVAIVAGRSDSSLLVKRLLLPKEDDHHMAPKEKPQLTKEEIALLSWWIDQGASFTARVGALAQPASVKPILSALQSSAAGGAAAASSGDDDEEAQAALMHNADIPGQPVEAAGAADLAALRAKGVLAEPVAVGSNYLAVNCVNARAVGDAFIDQLKPLRRQLVSLKLTRTAVTDAGLEKLAGFDALRRLDLDYTAVTDKGMGHLKGLEHLAILNLVGTNITGVGVSALKGLTGLKRVYLFRSKVDHAQWAGLQAGLKGVVLDSGGYEVPTLATDTQLVKVPGK